MFQVIQERVEARLSSIGSNFGLEEYEVGEAGQLLDQRLSAMILAQWESQGKAGGVVMSA